MQLNITKNLNNTDKLLLGFVQNGQSDKSERTKLLSQTHDWDDVLWQSRRHSVIPYAYHSLKETSASFVPGKYAQIFKDSFNNRHAKNNEALKELIKILKLFEQQGIKNIVLKGPYLAEKIYARPDMRAYSDIDILVQKQDVQRCQQIFSQMEFEQVLVNDDLFDKQGRTQHHFQKSNVMIDLHWEPLNNKWYPNVSSFFRENVWEEARKTPFHTTITWELSYEVLLIYQCVHLSIHHKFEKLIWFKDVDSILRSAKIDWASFVEKIKRYNLTTFCYYSLLFTKHLFSSPVPHKVLEDIKPGYLTVRLFEFLVRRENFFRLHHKKRRLAILLWRVCRDSFSERLKAIYWLLFPSIEWYLHYYPFLPQIKRTYYYPFYPLLIMLRMFSKPTNNLLIEK